MRFTSNFIVTASVALVAHFGLAQESEKIKKVQVTDFYITGGGLLTTMPTWNIDDFRTLAPQSTFANEDLSNFSEQNYYSFMDPFGSHNSRQLSMMIGMNFADKSGTTIKGNPHLRLGVTYRSGSLLQGSMSRTESFTFDTLVANNSGSTFLQDSVNYINYNMNYATQQIQVDASVLFRTSPERRASLFGGIGIAAGVGINSRTEIYRSESDYVEISGTGVNTTGYGSSYGGTNDLERTKNGAIFGSSIYVPMGVDLKFSMKNEFWKRVHWSFELRPAMNFMASPELGLLTTFSSYHGVGLKIHLR